jgi:hypothetical protein
VTDLRERRRQLLNLTITEIILIMLFLILLVTASLIKKNIEQEKMLEDFRALNVDETKLAEFRKFEKAIEQLKENNGEFVDMEIEEIINELVLAREKYFELKDKDSQIAKLVEKLKEFEKNQEQLAYYKEKYAKDKPPCWKKEGTIATVEYLYDATINDVGVVLINTDNRYPHRVQERKTLPLENVTENITLTANQFRDQTLVIFKLTENECRHFVFVKDQSGNDKGSKLHYKQILSAIEDRFYKYEDK